jgi:hypothetical protein
LGKKFNKESKNDPQIWKKVKNFYVLKCWRAQGFSCSLCVLFGGLGKSKLQFLIRKTFKIFPPEIFSNFWSLKTLDPELALDPDMQLVKMLDPHPH